ncbi:MAG: MMPL family transporter [Planctomycetota bacterium]
MDELRTLISTLNQSPNLLGIFQYLTNQRERLGESEVTEQDIESLAKFRQFLSDAVHGRSPSLFKIDPLIVRSQKRFSFVDEEGYFTLQRSLKSYLLFFIEPTNQTNDFTFNQQFLRYVQETVAQIPRPSVDFEIGYTGSPALNVAEMRDSRKGLFWGSIFSFTLVFILFIGLYYKFPSRPLFALVCLIFGIIWTFIFTSFYPGYLNLLSMAFALLVIGLGVDFGIHFISRFNEEIEHQPTEEALFQTLVRLTPPLFISALTTSGTFFLTMTTDFKGFAELGLIAGVGVMICLLITLTLLPALLLLFPSASEASRPHRRWFSVLFWPFQKIGYCCVFLVSPFTFLFQKITSWLLPLILYQYHWIVVLITFILTGFFAYSATFLEYDRNILNLQSKNSLEVDYMRKILAIGEFGVLFYPTSEENYVLQEYLDKLRYQGYQNYTFSIQDMVPPEQITRKKEMEALFLLPIFLKKNHKNFSADDFQVQLETLIDNFSEIHNLLVTKEQAGPLRLNLAQIIDDGKPDEGEDLVELLSVLEEKNEEKPFLEAIQQFSQQSLTQIRDLLEFLESVSKASPFTVEDLPEELKMIFISHDGKFRLIQIYPKGDIFEGETLGKFVEHLQLVSPLATGHPVMVYEMVKSIRESYEDVGWMALALIFCITFLLFRNLAETILGVFVLILGIIWMFGILVFLPHGNLNPANMIAIPLILGIGIDNIVHIIHRFREEKNLEKTMRQTGKAIVASSVTTIFGFLGMCIGTHQGLISLGNTLILGMACCLFMSLIVLPAFLMMFSDWRNWLLPPRNSSEVLRKDKELPKKS